MNHTATYETTCPNNHNQAIKLDREEFEAALESDTLIFHCNTCDTNWPPSTEDITKLRNYFSKE